MTGRTLKLYIDSTSLSVVHQVADFVACAENADVVKIMTWLRNPLPNDRMKRFNAAYVQQFAAVNDQFVGMVLQLVEKMGITAVEFHSNHHHARRGVLPVLQALHTQGRLDLDAVRLNLYDDGTLSIIDRNAFAMTVDPQAQLDAAVPMLRDAILARRPLEWSHALGLAWHRVVDTRYHMLCPDLTHRVPGGFDLIDHLGSAVVPMSFEYASRFGAADWSLYLELFGLDDEVRTTLRPFATRPDAFLYIGTGVWDKTENVRYGTLQKSTIVALKDHGVIRSGVPIGYKGHPANADYDTELMATLGHDTIRFPTRVPIEVLMMDGLLPQHVGGLASSSFITVPKDRLDFVLCDAGSRDEALSEPMVAWMVEHAIVDADKLVPWQH